MSLLNYIKIIAEPQISGQNLNNFLFTSYTGIDFTPSKNYSKSASSPLQFLMSVYDLPYRLLYFITV